MSHIELECEKCSAQHKIVSSRFAFEAVDSDEREMGPEITYEGSVEFDCGCGQAVEITHRYWEYPVGAENYKETDVSGARIVANSL